MFRLVLMVSVFAVLVAAIAVRDGAQSAIAAPAGAIPGQYIVVLNDGADPGAEAKNASRAQGVAIDHVYTHALNGFAFRGSAAAAAALARNPNIRYVIPDQAVSAADAPGGSGKPGGGGEAAAAQEVPTGVRRIGAYPATRTGFGVGVAVIDTGIDLTHPDLGSPVSGKNCIRPGRKAADDNGHGTHVAGTIAARDNTIGVVGVAPGATLYAVKVLNAAGSGSWSSVICGIDWVTANATSKGIKVANMSLGGAGAATPSDPSNCSNGNNDALHTAICKSVKAGVTYVVAAGNSASDASGFLPAAYEEVITVSALADYNGSAGGLASPTCASYGADDTFASFSNFGAPVDIAGPGVCIKSTWKGGGYKTISGTSMATPHVAGAAALYVGANLGASPNAVKTALLGSAEDGPIAGDDDGYAEGIVRVN